MVHCRLVQQCYSIGDKLSRISLCELTREILAGWMDIGSSGKEDPAMRSQVSHLRSLCFLNSSLLYLFPIGSHGFPTNALLFWDHLCDWT